ncbi:MAG: hypothetical protein C4298_02430 [Thermus sp.]
MLQTVSQNFSRFLEFLGNKLRFLILAALILPLAYGPLTAAQAQGPYAPTYLYRFAFRTPDFPGLGSFHGLELAPLFGNFDQMPFLALFLSQKAREEGERMGRILRRYWVNFAYQDAPKGWPRWEEIQEGMALLLDLPPRPLPLSALDPGSCALF